MNTKLETLLQELVNVDKNNLSQLKSDLYRDLQWLENQLSFELTEGGSERCIIGLKIEIEMIKIQLDSLKTLKQ